MLSFVFSEDNTVQKITYELRICSFEYHDPIYLKLVEYITMAIIYGRPDSELEILSEAPSHIEKFEDIDIEHRKLKDGLTKEKKVFFEKVPNKISEEEQNLEKMKKDETITEEEFNEKLRKLKEKKTEGGFTGFSASFKGFVVKNYSKRRAINKIKNLQEKQESSIKEWKENPGGIFNKEQDKTISEIKEFDKLKADPFYAGAKGEIDVLKKLSQLSDDYHVLCGLDIGLDHYVTYKRRKDLRSAQMDFVVVSKRGIILIEVKNWSSGYYKNHGGLSPHEQVDRAGLVLWIKLKSWRSPKNPSPSSVLLAVQGNMDYDHKYKFVNVKNLNTINYFIENKREQFSDKEAKRVVGRLEKYL